MRTNIVIDEELMARAMEISKIKTKREVVEVALKEFVQNNSRRNLLELKGKIRFKDDYDHKAQREGRQVDFS